MKQFENYDDTKPIRIWYGNLAKYNEGKLVGIWLSLPMCEEELQKATEAVLGEDEEYQLNDFECDIEGLVSEYSDVYQLNEIAEKLEDLDDDDLSRVSYLMTNNGMEFSEAIDNYEDVIVYEGTLKDVAEQLVDDGCFGEIPDLIANYIDYEAIGRDLRHDGYHYIAEENKVYFYNN